MPPPQALVPYLDDVPDAELGRALRLAVGLVRREGGYDPEDPEVGVEVKVTLRT